MSSSSEVSPGPSEEYESDLSSHAGNETPEISSDSPDSPQSSPTKAPLPKKRKRWEVKSPLGQPSKSTQSLWKRLEDENTDQLVRHEESCSPCRREGSLEQPDEVDNLNTWDIDHSSLQNLPVCPQSTSSSDSESVLSEVSDLSEVSISQEIVRTVLSGKDQEENEGTVTNPPLVIELSDSGSSVNSDYSVSDSEDEVCDALYEGSDLTVDEAVYDLLNDYFTNKETQRSLKSHLKTFVKYIPKTNKMPKTVKRLFKYVEGLVPSLVPESHFYCARCLASWSDTSKQNCDVCQHVEKKTFYTFSLENQLRHLLENSDLAEQLENAKQNQPTDSSIIRDIKDGAEYKQLQVGGHDLTLMWYVDGVSVSGSSKKEIWPLQFQICEQSYRERTMDIGVYAIWCDTSKPLMNTFLAPFAQAVKDIERKGGLKWKHPVTGQQHVSSISAPLLCGDAPARADAQNVQRPNGKYACNTCEEKTVRIPLSREEEKAKTQGKKVKRRRAFVYTDKRAPLRTDLEMKKQANAATQSKKRAVKGVKGRTCAEQIKGLDVANFVYAEYMHGVCLGVVKLFLNLWLVVPGPWNIKYHIDRVDEFVDNVKPTSELGRIMKCASEFVRWKASEFRMWLLFVSLPAVHQFLEKKYVQHWILFVTAIFYLLRDEISPRDIETAEVMLTLFVQQIGTLYRLQDYVFNVHQLLHLPLYVKRWGPLWATSAFSFEGFNGILVKMLHGTKNPAKELMLNLRRAYGMQILKKKNSKLPRSNKIFIDPAHCRSFKVLSECDKAVLRSKGFVLSDVKIYIRVTVLREKFTSLLYPFEKRRNNFTVCFKATSSTSFGEIKFFVVKNDSVTLSDTFAVIKLFNVNQARFFQHSESRSVVNHIIPVENSDELDVVPLRDFVSKVFRVGSYVCYLPNKFERNL